jgi:hypothetical protein
MHFQNFKMNAYSLQGLNYKIAFNLILNITPQNIRIGVV